MSGERDEPEVGSVAEEAVKLLGALSDWAKDTGHQMGHGAGLGLDEHLATGAAECTYCPICRTVHAVRQLSPEVRAQLAVAGNALLQAAAGLLASATADHQDRRQDGSVAHIDLDDDAEWPEESAESADSEEEDR